jgi:hypothetical protein
MKRAAIYCRVSTVHHRQSVDMQLHDLRKLAEQRGFQIAKEYDIVPNLGPRPVNIVVNAWSGLKQRKHAEGPQD